MSIISVLLIVAGFAYALDEYRENVRRVDDRRRREGTS